MAAYSQVTSEIGAHEFEKMTYNRYALVLAFDYSDINTSGSVRLTVPAGTIVEGVGLLVSGSFSGSDLMMVGYEEGSTSDLDFFLDEVMCASGSVSGRYVQSMGAPLSDHFSGSIGYYAPGALGRYFTAAGQIVVAMTIKPVYTNGEATLFVYCIGAESNWRRTASGY